MTKLWITRLLLLPALLPGLLLFAQAPSGGTFGGQVQTADTSNYTPTEREANRYTLEQAADIVVRGLSLCNRDNPIKAQVMPDIIATSWQVPSQAFGVWEFREMHDIRLAFDPGFWRQVVGVSPDFLDISWNGHAFQGGRQSSKFAQRCTNLGEDWTKDFGDALFRLKLEYDKSNNPENMARFKEEALRYHEMNPKPQLPEEARRFKVQAEEAVEAMRFLDAAEKYRKANEIAPWWPEGHFNRALVLGEVQNFDSAMVEMKRYLLLKPDAPDARLAQDKIYSWEAHPFEVRGAVELPR